MQYSLKRITDPAIEPVTVAEVKLHAHIDHSVEDALIASWIKSARILCEDFQGKSYIGQVWELTFDKFPCLPIKLPRSPVMSVLSIKLIDIENNETTVYENTENLLTTTEEPSTTIEGNTDFIIDIDHVPPRITFAYCKTWPSIVLREIASVKIRYAAGFGLKTTDVPETVREAIMLYCTFRNENRSSEVEELPSSIRSLLSIDRIFL